MIDDWKKEWVAELNTVNTTCSGCKIHLRDLTETTFPSEVQDNIRAEDCKCHRQYCL